jgi:actin-related protein 6
MLTAWECEKIVWDRVFNQIKIKPSETSLLVTEPYFNLPSLAETFDQMVFEEWEFQSYYRCSRELRFYGGFRFGFPAGIKHVCSAG